MPHRGKNKRFSTLRCAKAGGTQPKLSAACFTVHSCPADADFVVFSNHCLIVKRFGKKTIFDRASATIQKGTIVGAIGANGVGKSVLFKMISGIYRPNAGNIYVRGEKIGEMFDFPSNVGVFIDNPGFVPMFSGLYNLKLLADIRGMITEAGIAAAMELVGLDPQNKTLAKNYSLGMKQKLGIAQAIMENQDILLFDEPFNALDGRSHLQMRELLREMRANGKTGLLTSHNMDDIWSLCDLVYEIENYTLSLIK
mgnify:CR=1 FL=1